MAVALASPYQSENPKQSATILKLNPEEAQDTYEVYSAVLGERHDVHAWTILTETNTFTFCLKPPAEFASVYRPVIEDFAKKDRTKFNLEAKFNLPDYTLGSPQGPPGIGTSKAQVTLSAVGFNRDRTRAYVCYSVKDQNGTGSSGSCLFLVRMNGKWLSDNDSHSPGCGFGFGGAVYR